MDWPISRAERVARLNNTTIVHPLHLTLGTVLPSSVDCLLLRPMAGCGHPDNIHSCKR